MQEVLGNIHEEMDIPGYYAWLDDGEPPTAIVEQGGEEQMQAVTLSLSKRAETMFTDLVSSAQEDIQNKLQKIADSTRTKVSIG